MPDGREGSPKASLLIIAFQQAAYIDETIDSAFSQDYRNLEIVLSDDGSTDGTWERIIERAARYAGPHEIKTNRTGSNGKGILHHIYSAVVAASGDLIVLLAGDDTSVVHRVSRLVEVWQQTDADGMDSHFALTDAAGTILNPDFVSPAVGSEARAIFGRDVTMLHGAASAYSRRTFDAIAEPAIPIWNEDEFLCLFLNWRGRRLVRLPESLVHYRQHGAASTNQADVTTPTEVTERERRARRLAGSMADVLDLLLAAVITGAGIQADFGTPTPLNVGRLRAYIRYWRARAGWLNASVFSRLAMLPCARSFSHLRWMMPRLLGPKPLAWARSIARIRTRAW